MLRVVACGVCRTNLHIVTAELPLIKPALVPGHQIVGETVEGPTATLAIGRRVGVSWLGGTDGTCWYCRHDRENLCDHRSLQGVRWMEATQSSSSFAQTFWFPLPDGMDDAPAAPLLCAGITGFRSLRVVGVGPGERVGLYGFGSSASLAIEILHSYECEVYVSTRGQGKRARAAILKATRVGTAEDKPPIELDRAITFAPSGAVVVNALASLRKGGVVAVNAIHFGPDASV